LLFSSPQSLSLRQSRLLPVRQSLLQWPLQKLPQHRKDMVYVFNIRISKIFLTISSLMETTHLQRVVMEGKSTINLMSEQTLMICLAMETTVELEPQILHLQSTE
jgi:hypothetical protein